MLKYKIDKTLNIIFVQPEENFRLEQILMHIDELAIDPDYRQGINAIYDFSKVQHVEGDLTALMAVAGRMEDSTIIKKSSNVAIIVSNENMFRIFQGYCLMASSSVVQYQLFWDKEIDLALHFVKCKQLPSFDG